MYNYSGVYYRFLSPCAFLILGVLMVVLFSKPKKKGERWKNKAAIIVGLVTTIWMLSLYTASLVFPNVSSYTGEFIKYNRDSRDAPPLPFTNEYIFWDGKGTKEGFYLDIFSKKKIFPDDFEKAREYTVYYDKKTDIILKVEIPSAQYQGNSTGNDDCKRDIRSRCKSDHYALSGGIPCPIRIRNHP